MNITQQINITRNNRNQFVWLLITVIVVMVVYIFVIRTIQPTVDILQIPQTEVVPVLTINHESVGLTANEIIERYKKGQIRQEFPAQFLDEPIEKIKQMADSGDRAAKKAMKLLTDNRFNKTNNRK